MPQLLTDAEVKQLGTAPLGRKHPVRIWIEQLQAGENLYVKRIDFLWKRQTPSRFVNEIMRAGSKKFTLVKTRNKSGWIVTRTE